MKIRYYLDENVSPVIAEQLRKRGIEVYTPQELNTLGDSDTNHLQRAAGMGCVLCTHDDDYLSLAASGMEHAGIVLGHSIKHSIGDWVKGLELLHMAHTPDEMANNIEYL